MSRAHPDAPIWSRIGIGTSGHGGHESHVDVAGADLFSPPCATGQMGDT